MVTVRSNAELAFSQSFNGPFEATNGDLFVFIRDGVTASIMRVMRSTDGGSNWSQEDTWQPNGDLSSIHTAQDPTSTDLVHVAVMESGADGVYYRRYDMGNAVWDASAVLVYDSNINLARHVSIAVDPNDNQSLFIGYQHDNVTIKGNNYERVGYSVSTDGGSSWNGGNQLDAGGTSVEASYQGVEVTVDNNGRAHFFYVNVPDELWLNRTYESGSLNTEQQWASSPAPTGYPHKSAFYSSNTGLIHVSYATDTAGDFYEAVFTPGSTLTLDITRTIDGNIGAANEVGAATQGMIVDNGDTLYAVSSNGNVGAVVYYERSTSGTWTGPTTVNSADKDGGTNVSANMLGSSLGILFDNSTPNTFFEEVQFVTNVADSDSGTGTDTVALSTPKGLSVTTISATELEIDWFIEAGADNYDLEREKQGGGGGDWINTTLLTDVGDPPYNDTGLDGGTTYRYRVRSVGVVT